MKLVIRLDVSVEIGTGHWRRMCNLLEFIPGAEPVFVICTDDCSNHLFSGSKVYFVPDSDEIQTLAEICKTEQPALLLLDLLTYAPGYVEQLKRAVRRSIVSFHEFQDWTEFSDLVINCNTFTGFERAETTKVLAGPRYIILNRDILNIRRGTDPSGVLVTFGGSDPSRFAEQFIARVVPQCAEVPFILHTGPFFPKPRDWNVLTRCKNLRVTSPVDSVFDLMGSCRMAVTAGGNSMYEFIYLGFNPLVVAHNARQAEFARNAAKLGLCQFYGAGSNVEWEKLAAAVQHQYPRPPMMPPSFIDGLGAKRIVDRLAPVAP